MKAKLLHYPAVLLLLLWMAGCGGEVANDTDKTTIVFWHSFVSSTIPALEDLLERFEAEHPDIKIKAQYVPTGDALLQKLITAVQSESAPDISWVHAEFFKALAEADAIYPMHYFIDGEDGLSDAQLDDIFPALTKLASWKGILYSMPMEATNLALLYNKEMFRQGDLIPNHRHKPGSSCLIMPGR